MGGVVGEAEGAAGGGSGVVVDRPEALGIDPARIGYQFLPRSCHESLGQDNRVCQRFKGYQCVQRGTLSQLFLEQGSLSGCRHQDLDVTIAQNMCYLCRLE